jgi:hypothetical protein
MAIVVKKTQAEANKDITTMINSIKMLSNTSFIYNNKSGHYRPNIGTIFNSGIINEYINCTMNDPDIQVVLTYIINNQPQISRVIYIYIDFFYNITELLVKYINEVITQQANSSAERSGAAENEQEQQARINEITNQIDTIMDEYRKSLNILNKRPITQTKTSVDLFDKPHLIEDTVNDIINIDISGDNFDKIKIKELFDKCIEELYNDYYEALSTRIGVRSQTKKQTKMSNTNTQLLTTNNHIKYNVNSYAFHINTKNNTIVLKDELLKFINVTQIKISNRGVSHASRMGASKTNLTRKANTPQPSLSQQLPTKPQPTEQLPTKPQPSQQLPTNPKPRSKSMIPLFSGFPRTGK